jgi:hypothetical protein
MWWLYVQTGRQMLENYGSAQDSIASWSTNTLDKRTPMRMSSNEQAMASGLSQMGRTVSMPQVQVTPELAVISHGSVCLLTIDECAGSADEQPGNKMAVTRRSELCLLNGEKLSTAGPLLLLLVLASVLCIS